MVSSVQGVLSFPKMRMGLESTGIDADIDITSELHPVPEVKEGPMTRSKTKQLRKRFNLAVQYLMSSFLELEDINWSIPTFYQPHLTGYDQIEKEELTEAFNQMSLGRTTPTGMKSPLAGQESSRSLEKTMELKERHKTSYTSKSDSESKDQDQSTKDVEDLQETNQATQERPQEHFKKPAKPPEVIQGAEQQVLQEVHQELVQGASIHLKARPAPRH